MAISDGKKGGKPGIKQRVSLSASDSKKLQAVIMNIKQFLV